MRKNSLKKNISYEHLLGRVKTDTLPHQHNSLRLCALYAPHITWILGVSRCARVSDADGSAHVAIRTRKAQLSHVPVRSRHGALQAEVRSAVGGCAASAGSAGCGEAGQAKAAAETGSSRLSPCIRAGLRGALPSHRPNAKPAPGRRALVPVAQAAAVAAR